MLRAPGSCHRRATLLVALASLVVGCASEPKRTSRAWSGTDRAAQVALDTARLLSPGPERLDLVAPDAETAVRTAGPPVRTEDGHTEWTVSLESAGETRRTLTLRKGTDGSTALVTLSEPRAGRTLSFDPPLLMMPAQLNAGPGVEDEASATETDDAGLVKRTGRATVRIEPVDPPAFALGTAALGIRRTLRITLGPAVIERRTTIAVGPMHTWAGERSTRVVKVFGLTVDRDEETWLPVSVDQ